MNTFANKVAASAITSIDQRRTVPMVSTVMQISSHSRLSILNRNLKIWDGCG
jgi:hypothetical protein